jgi:ribose 5-phosphate isomerase B
MDKIYIASDHGGYNLKEVLISYLSKKGYEVIDEGNKTFDTNDDYPDFIIPMSEKVAKDKCVGIVLGRSGNGEAIAANKVKGIRAALCMNVEMARKARMDNDANILSLGADIIAQPEALEVVDAFLETPFSGKERHIRRINKISQYESS